jgi:hypothetical protein
MQFSLATAQRRPKLVFQFVKIVELLPDLREFCVQATADWRARLQPGTSKFQQVANLAERKSERLHTPNKFQSLDIAFAILTETARRARWTRQESITLIEANGIGCQADLFGDCADLHAWLLLPKLTPWSIVQSQDSTALTGCGKSGFEKRFAVAGRKHPNIK